MDKFSKIPTILPVIPPDPRPTKMSPPHPHLPNVEGEGGGALLLLISPVRSGKSTLISNMLLREDFYDAQERFDQVSVISNTILNDVTSRFLRKAFEGNCHDFYDDSIIHGIIASQKKYDKEDQPEIALVLDDCLGSIKQNSAINHLCSRYRHFNIKLLVISSQKFRGSVSPIIRANATDIIIGSPFPNQAELNAVAEEYGDLFGGQKNWLKLYKKATPNRYDFCYMDCQENPPVMYSNFEKVIAIGDTCSVDCDSDSDSDSEEEVEVKDK
tara:strand:+ start:1678 stop:2490 length:813 start_codon:yes stop_codon:yes gene_type:complete